MFSPVSKKLLASIFDAALAPELWPAALQSIADRVGAAGAGLVIRDKLNGGVGIATLVGPAAARTEDYIRYYHAKDLCYAFLDDAPVGAWNRLSRRVPAAILRRNEWYNDCVLRMGIEDGIGVRVFENSSCVATFALHQAIGQTPFVSSRARILNEIVAILGNAVRTQTDLGRRGWIAGLAPQVLDRLVAGIVIVAPDGRVMEANRAAELILRRGDGLVARQGRLRGRRQFESTALTRLIRRATAPRGEATSGNLSIVRDPPGAAYLVTVSPFNPTVGATQENLAILLIVDPEAERPSEGELAAIYGLTSAEARLAAALARGMKVDDIAAQSGVKVTTLRTQIRPVLEKVGVDRQIDLVRVLSTTRHLIVS